jgi:site-specific DNA-methyltransferase (adenine-specific)
VTPYYDRDGITLYLGDCREILPQLERDGADLLMLDPAYGETKLSWDLRDLSFIDLADPLLKETGSMWCFGSMRMFLEEGAQLLERWRFAQDIVWEKQNGTNSADDRFKRVHESACHFWRRRTPWETVYKKVVTTPDAVANQMRRKQRPPHWGSIGEHTYVSEDGGPRLARSVFHVANCHGYAVHPTQKPLDILRPLLEHSCPPGGLVVDPTCGSGSTLVEAKRLGMRAIGIEAVEQHCESAARRCGQELALGVRA